MHRGKGVNFEVISNEEQAPHLGIVHSPPPQMVECTKNDYLAFTMEIKLIPRKSCTAAYKELVSK